MSRTDGVIGAIARHAPANLAGASFTADTAAKTGQSERSIQLDDEGGDNISHVAFYVAWSCRRSR